MSAALSMVDDPEAPCWRDAVAEVARIYQRGDVVPRAWLECALGADPDRDRETWWVRLGFLKTALLRHHKMDLQPAGGYDQRIIESRRQVETARADHAREVRRSVRRLRARTEHVETKDFSQAERQKYFDDLARTRAYTDAVEHTLRHKLDAPAPAIGDGADDDDEGEDK